MIAQHDLANGIAVDEHAKTRAERQTHAVDENAEPSAGRAEFGIRAKAARHDAADRRSG